MLTEQQQTGRATQSTGFRPGFPARHCEVPLLPLAQTMTTWLTCSSMTPCTASGQASWSMHPTGSSSMGTTSRASPQGKQVFSSRASEGYGSCLRQPSKGAHGALCKACVMSLFAATLPPSPGVRAAWTTLWSPLASSLTSPRCARQLLQRALIHREHTVVRRSVHAAGAHPPTPVPSLPLLAPAGLRPHQGWCQARHHQCPIRGRSHVRDGRESHQVRPLEGHCGLQRLLHNQLPSTTGKGTPASLTAVYTPPHQDGAAGFQCMLSLSWCPEPDGARVPMCVLHVFVCCAAHRLLMRSLASRRV